MKPKGPPAGVGSLFIAAPPAADPTKLNVPTSLVDLSKTPVVSERVMRLVAPPPPPAAAPYPADGEDVSPVTLEASHQPGHFWLAFRRGGSSRPYASVLVDGEQLRAIATLAAATLEREGT